MHMSILYYKYTWAYYMEPHMHRCTAMQLLHMHFIGNGATTCSCVCLLKQCFSFTLNLFDAAFDKSALLLDWSVSFQQAYSAAGAFIMLAGKSTVSEEPVESFCAHTALSHKSITERTNRLVLGHRLLLLSFHHLHHFYHRRPKSTFVTVCYISSHYVSFIPVFWQHKCRQFI